MVSIVADGTTDMAQGSMHHPDGVMVDVSGFRQLTSKVASLVMRIATGSKLHTFTNLYRADLGRRAAGAASTSAATSSSPSPASPGSPSCCSS